MQVISKEEYIVATINSISKKHKALRQDSKAPTFALTYAGTWLTLVHNCGFSKDLAKRIEKAYHELYVHSDIYMADRLKEVCMQGYGTLAFGLRLRAPILAKCFLGQKDTPTEAAAEGRSMGNAFVQSYGLLNSRAVNEFMAKVWESEYATSILPIVQIHDASYYLVKNDLATLHFVNTHLVNAVRWQDTPELAHPDVKLGGELSLFWPSWANEIEIPNNATPEEILAICQKGQNDYLEKA